MAAAAARWLWATRLALVAASYTLHAWSPGAPAADAVLGRLRHAQAHPPDLAPPPPGDAVLAPAAVLAVTEAVAVAAGLLACGLLYDSARCGPRAAALGSLAFMVAGNALVMLSFTAQLGSAGAAPSPNADATAAAPLAFPPPLHRTSPPRSQGSHVHNTNLNISDDYTTTSTAAAANGTALVHGGWPRYAVLAALSTACAGAGGAYVVAAQTAAQLTGTVAGVAGLVPAPCARA